MFTQDFLTSFTQCLWSRMSIKVQTSRYKRFDWKRIFMTWCRRKVMFIKYKACIERWEVKELNSVFVCKFKILCVVRRALECGSIIFRSIQDYSKSPFILTMGPGVTLALSPVTSPGQTFNYTNTDQRNIKTENHPQTSCSNFNPYPSSVQCT